MKRTYPLDKALEDELKRGFVDTDNAGGYKFFIDVWQDVKNSGSNQNNEAQ